MSNLDLEYGFSRKIEEVYTLKSCLYTPHLSLFVCVQIISNYLETYVFLPLLNLVLLVSHNISLDHQTFIGDKRNSTSEIIKKLYIEQLKITNQITSLECELHKQKDNQANNEKDNVYLSTSLIDLMSESQEACTINFDLL